MPRNTHQSAREIVDQARDATLVPVDLMLDDDGLPTGPVSEIQDSLWPGLLVAAQASAGQRRTTFRRELNASDDKDCWTRDREPPDSPGPVLAMLGPFDAFSYSPMAWLLPEAESRPELTRTPWGRWRVAIRDRANQKDERICIAAIIPPSAATCHYLNVCSEPTEDVRAVIVVAAIANSLLLDYIARPFVGTHMSSGILKKLPWALSDEALADSDLRDDVLRLTCIRPEYDGLPEAAGFSNVAPALTLPDRAACRARLDARVARLYRLSSKDFAHVLGWFRLLDQDQPPLPGEPKSFITRDLALLEYLRLLGEAPPDDVVAFFGEAGVDLAPLTGEVRGLVERVRLATEQGAVAYVPSSRGGAGQDDGEGGEEGAEADPGVPEPPPPPRGRAKRGKKGP